jgi:hypothetical protein
VPERLDDFAWENDLIAFRAYGPAIVRNKGLEDSGIDCWLKRVKHPIIDGWYKRGDYHIDRGEGCDPYHVGASRGCGGTALWRDGRLITSGPFKTWEIVSRKPERSEFILTYEYSLDGKVVMEMKRITIELSKRLFRSESTFTQDGKPFQTEVAVGITTHDGKASVRLNPSAGWMTCWENIEGSGLGTGVVIDPRFKAQMREIKDPAKDRSHALAILKTDPAGKIVFFAGYGWEKAGGITSETEWNAALQNLADSLAK